MENTGAGANGNKKGKSNMAEPSKRSRTKEKPNTKKTKQPITPAEAVELLTSALSYCEEAKVIVEGYNEPEGLHLFVRDTRYLKGKVVLGAEKVTGT